MEVPPPRLKFATAYACSLRIWLSLTGGLGECADGVEVLTRATANSGPCLRTDADSFAA